MNLNSEQLLNDIYAMTADFRRANGHDYAFSRNLIPVFDGFELYVECQLNEWDVVYGVTAIAGDQLCEEPIFVDSFEKAIRLIRHFTATAAIVF